MHADLTGYDVDTLFHFRSVFHWLWIIFTSKFSSRQKNCEWPNFCHKIWRFNICNISIMRHFWRKSQQRNKHTLWKKDKQCIVLLSMSILKPENSIHYVGVFLSFLSWDFLCILHARPLSMRHFLEYIHCLNDFDHEFLLLNYNFDIINFLKEKFIFGANGIVKVSRCDRSAIMSGKL